MKAGPTFILKLLRKISRGSCISDIRVFNKTIYAGDILRSLSIYELKEVPRLGGNYHHNNLPQQDAKLEELSQHLQQVWVTALLPLNEEQVLCFDRQRNIMLFKRTMDSLNDQQRHKVAVTSGTRFGEEVSTAIFGNLNILCGQQATEETSAN